MPATAENQATAVVAEASSWINDVSIGEDDDSNRDDASISMDDMPAIAEAQFIVPDRADKVDYGIGLSYRPVRLHRAGGQVRQPIAIVDFIPH